MKTKNFNALFMFARIGCILLLFTTNVFSQLNIYPVGSTGPVDPNVQYAYTAFDYNVNNFLGLGCNFNWTVTNGTIIGGSTSGNVSTMTTGSIMITVVWNNTSGNGVIKVTTDQCYSSYYNNNSATQTYKIIPISTGINDVVKIKDPPPNTPGLPDGSIMPPNTTIFSAGDKTSFYAQFTSGDGTTYVLPNGWNWKIELYHSGGTYIYAEENKGLDDRWRWVTTTSPTLPNYNWLIANGKIMGKLTLTVSINDGDYKSDQISISVTPPPSCVSSITGTNYTTNAYINGCDNITLQNVTINNCSVTVDSPGNIIINKPFEAKIGSAFEAK